MKPTFYFEVILPDRPGSLTYIGGPLKPSKRPGHVWLTTPAGERLIELPRVCVRPSSKAEMLERVSQDLAAERERRRQLERN